MDFRSFMAARPQLLTSTGKPVLDLTDTRMADGLARFRPAPSSFLYPEKAYRCHLAEDWLATFRLPAEWRRRALVSQGVRASLGVLFQHFREQGASVALPSDVYPVYWQLAQDAGLEPVPYASLDDIAPELLDADIILLCDPAKPRGEHLSPQSVDRLVGWLKAYQKRRLVLDAVYTFELDFGPLVRRLIDTGQVWLLHSLSKGWAEPLVFGVALCPEADLETGIVARFRELPSDQEKLRLAHAIFRQDLQFPDQARRLIEKANEAMSAHPAMAGINFRTGPHMAVRYLHLVEQPYQDLLRERNVLGLPIEVFGSQRQYLTVVSSLCFLG